MTAWVDSVKNKPFERALPYFFTPRIHGKDPDNLPALEESESVIEDILRWADDGGQNVGPWQPNRQAKPGSGSGTGKHIIKVRGKGN